MLSSPRGEQAETPEKPAEFNSSIHSGLRKRAPTGKAELAERAHHAGRIPLTRSQNRLGAGSPAISGARGRISLLRRSKPSAEAAISLSPSTAPTKSKLAEAKLSSSLHGTQRM